jgi:hypothetical protein
VATDDPGRRDRAQDEALAHAGLGIDNVYFNIKSERHSYYQALLSLGDRRIAPAIELAETNGGQWRKAVADAGLDGDFYIYRDRSNDAVLPWNMIDGGMKEPFFRAEFEKSTRGRMDAAAQARQGKRAPHSRSQLTARQLAPPVCQSARDRRARLEFRVRLEHQIPDRVLRVGVADRTQQREAAALAVDRIRARGERDVAARPVAALPHRKPEQPQAVERSFREVEFGVGKFSGRLTFSFGMILITMWLLQSLVLPVARQDLAIPSCCVVLTDG